MLRQKDGARWRFDEKPCRSGREGEYGALRADMKKCNPAIAGYEVVGLTRLVPISPQSADVAS
jgi:hypothetical protein